jgi:hypothetical protein
LPDVLPEDELDEPLDPSDEDEPPDVLGFELPDSVEDGLDVPALRSAVLLRESVL